MFSYITFFAALSSVIALHFHPTLLIPTIVTLSFWAVSTVFYLLRKLTKAKFDWTEKSIELENDVNENDNSTKSIEKLSTSNANEIDEQDIGD